MRATTTARTRGIGAAVLIFAMAGAFDPASANCEAKPQPAKWCGTTSIPWSFGEGLAGSVGGTALSIKLAIQQAVSAVNLELAILGSSIRLNSGAGNGITFSYGAGIAKGSGSCASPSGSLAYTRLSFSVSPSSKIGSLAKAEVDFSDQFTGWTGNMVLNTAYHEIGHALGIDHVYPIPPGPCPPSGSSRPLMYESHECTDNPGLDGLFDKAIQCLYGADYEGGPLWGSKVEYKSGLKMKTIRSSCSGSSSCNFAAWDSALGALHYELLISDDGGPFVPFASLNDSDWVDNAFEYEFATSYVNARVQMQVWDGATMIAAPVSDAISIPAGACSVIPCPAAGSCQDAVCDPTTGLCGAEPQPDGSACDDPGSCIVGGVCSSGVCTGTPGSPPAEVDDGVRLSKAGGATITWNLATNATSSAVLRGLMSMLPVGPGGGDEACLVSNLPPSTSSFADGEIPAAGTGFWYLVRGDSGCGNGPLGFRAQNGAPTTPRVTTTCP